MLKVAFALFSIIHAAAIVITPHVKTNESFIPPESKRFVLGPLEPDTEYTLRISYAASSPASFAITFSDKTRVLTKTGSGSQRNLLDTKTASFHTAAVLPSSPFLTADISCIRGAFPASEEAAKRPVIAHLHLYAVYAHYGWMPRSAFLKMATVAVTLLAAAFVIAPVTNMIIRTVKRVPTRKE